MLDLMKIPTFWMYVWLYAFSCKKKKKRFFLPSLALKLLNSSSNKPKINQPEQEQNLKISIQMSEVVKFCGVIEKNPKQ